MAARLQFADPEGKPHLLNVDSNGGHIYHSHLNRCRRISSEHGFLMQQIGVALEEKEDDAPFLAMRQPFFALRLKREQKAEDYQEHAKYRAMLRKLKKRARFTE